MLTFVFAVALVWLKHIVRRCYVHLRRRGRILRQVVVVGANEEGRAIAEMLELAPELGYRVVGFVDDLAGSNGIKVLGPTADGPAIGGPATDGLAIDGPATDGPAPPSPAPA